MLIKNYKPSKFGNPKKLPIISAWAGLEAIIPDIIQTFKIAPGRALEFGVEYGYSTYALAQYFDKVIGVDTFQGDEHAGVHEIDMEAIQSVMPPNVLLIKSNYKDYQDDEKYDMIHIDIVHTYKDTFECGDWSMKHSDLVIFHDTQSFPEVKRAVEDLATKYGAEFYNYPFFNGLGILCKSQS